MKIWHRLFIVFIRFWLDLYRIPFAFVARINSKTWLRESDRRSINFTNGVVIVSTLQIFTFTVIFKIIHPQHFFINQLETICVILVALCITQLNQHLLIKKEIGVDIYKRWGTINIFRKIITYIVCMVIILLFFIKI